LTESEEEVKDVEEDVEPNPVPEDEPHPNPDDDDDSIGSAKTGAKSMKSSRHSQKSKGKKSVYGISEASWMAKGKKQDWKKEQEQSKVAHIFLGPSPQLAIQQLVGFDFYSYTKDPAAALEHAMGLCFLSRSFDNRYSDEDYYYKEFVKRVNEFADKLLEMIQVLTKRDERVREEEQRFLNLVLRTYLRLFADFADCEDLDKKKDVYALDKTKCTSLIQQISELIKQCQAHPFLMRELLLVSAIDTNVSLINYY